MSLSIRIALVATLSSTCHRAPAPRVATAPSAAIRSTASATPAVAPATPTAPSAAPRRETVTVQLAAMEDAFCARVESGHVYCWGNGSEGQIGDGALDNRSRPRRVVGIEHASSLVAENKRACVIEDGRVSCWGTWFDGDRVQPRPRATPAPVAGITDAVEISLGFPHVCVRHATGLVTCHSVHGGEDSPVVPIALPVPATALSGAEDQHCASTREGVYCFHFATISGGSGLLEAPRRMMVSHQRITVGPRAVCGTDGTSVECANLSYASPNTTIPVHATAFMSFETRPDGYRPSLCLVADGAVGCAEDMQWPAPPIFTGLDVSSVAGNLHRCALLRSGEVQCVTDLRMAPQPLAIGTAQPAGRPSTLTPEVAAHGSIENARLDANGRLEYCLVVRAEVGNDVSNRQCFALGPDATSVEDMTTWVDPPPSAWWENDQLSFQHGSVQRSFPLPGTASTQNTEVGAAVDARGSIVAAAIPEDASPSTRNVTVIDTATGTTRFTLRLPHHLSQDDRLLGGLFVEEWANDMIDGGTFRVDVFGAGGVHAHTGVCIRSEDDPRCSWEIAADALAVNTQAGVVIFRGPRARRETTRFRPGEHTAMVLEDPARHRLYVLGNQPIGVVEVFDMQTQRTIRTVAPRAP